MLVEPNAKAVMEPAIGLEKGPVRSDAMVVEENAKLESNNRGTRQNGLEMFEKRNEIISKS